MLGTLLRMSGPPTAKELEDLVLRWLVLAKEGGDAEIYEADSIGNLLLQIHCKITEPEDEEGEARDPLIRGQDLYNVMFTYYCRGYAPRIVRELKHRGLDHDHINTEWVRDRESFGWQEGFDLSAAVFRTSLAQKVAEALGGNDASDSIALWAYHDKMDRERASV